jgi:hypothetical protein
VQCPLEAIHGRKSLVHNAISAGGLGYMGVASGVAGVPFVPSHLLYRNAMRLRPAAIGGLVYGALGGFMGALSGKPL